MLATIPLFPDCLPDGYQEFEDVTIYDPSKHLSLEFPAAGYAIFQQGNMVVHRAAKLLEPADRITIVPGLVSRDIDFPDPTAKHDMRSYNEPGIVTELARHSAWLAQTKLQNYIKSASLFDDVKLIEKDLLNAISDISETLEYVRGADKPIKPLTM